VSGTDRCLTCWEHGSPFDGPCPYCGFNRTFEKLEERKPCTSMPSEEAALFIQWSDDGQYIRKWSREPFDGATRFATSTNIDRDAVRKEVLEEAARVAERMYVQDAFRFEFGNDIATAIRSLAVKGEGE
jgi:hypothetical protein